jgi:CDP-diacylglycerol--glycerol-3-phosphate 3-phosphatidyltransferase
MTLPNKLTIGRIIAVPLMVTVACIPALNDHFIFNDGGCYLTIANFVNLIIFILASITDFLDGHIARKYNLVTTFGKFADPLADKMLVLTSFLILMVQIWEIMLIIITIIIAITIVITIIIINVINIIIAIA